MIRQPTDADGIVLPRVSTDAAWDAASGFTSVASHAQAAADALAAAPVSAVCWSGEAADAYRASRARLAHHVTEVAEVASAAAGVVLDWLRQAAPALGVMRAAAERVRAVQLRVDAAAALAYDPALDAALRTEVDTAYAQWHAGRDAYWSSVDVAARRFLALRDGIGDRRLDTQDQVEGAGQTVWNGYVHDPVAAVWSVTALAVVDRERWWRNVSTLPERFADQVAAVAQDPAAAGEEAVGLTDLEAGRVGVGVAEAAMVLLPSPKWLSLGEEAGRLRFAKHLADRDAPEPVVQTVDEMLDGVDLQRHEHAELGHALRRHVEVDDDYLMDRLTYGTLLDDNARGLRPKEASRFTDRATAERAITDTLQGNATALRAFASNAPPGQRVRLTITLDHDVGQVMKQAGSGFSLRPGRKVVVGIRMGPQGPYIETAFVE